MISFWNGLKWLALLLVVVPLAPNLNAEESAGVGTVVKSAAPVPERTYVVAFAQDDMSNDWRKAQVDELREALAPYPDVRFLFSDAQGQTSRQILDIEDFITQEVDVLVTSPRDTKALTPVISRAYRHGIPVVLLTRRIENDNYSTFIGADDRLIARQAARCLAEILDGHGRILMVEGLPTASTAVDRTEAFKLELANYPGLKLVAEKTANYLRAEAIQAVEEVLQAKTLFDAVYAQSDSMASGVRMALRKAGRDPRDFHIVGIDYITEARDAIRKGEQDASFTYPTGGREGAQYILKILRGESIPKKVLLKSVRVMQDNVETIEPIF